MYVPDPPDPVMKAVTIVPGSTFAPEIAIPTRSEPEPAVTVDTVSVVELAGMDPTTAGAYPDGGAPNPAGQ